MSFIPQRISVGTTSSVSGTTGTGAAGRVAYWQDATTLTSSATFLFNGTSLQVPNGAVGTPSYGFASDPDNGMYLTGTNAIALVTAGANRLTIASNGDSVFTGGLSVEAGTGTDTMFRVRGNSQTAGTLQFGGIFDTIFSSTATSGVYGVSSNPQLANASFTCGWAYGFYAGNITPLGGTATLTRAVSFFSATQSNGTNNASIADNITFTGNWFINSTNTAQSLFSGNITVSSSGGPQYVAKDGGAFGTNADPHIQFEDTTGSGGRIGFTDGASKDFKIQNQTDTGLLDFVTTATQIAGSAGASTGTYWTIKLGGTTYKLLLYANA